MTATAVIKNCRFASPKSREKERVESRVTVGGHAVCSRVQCRLDTLKCLASKKGNVWGIINRSHHEQLIFCHALEPSERSETPVGWWLRRGSVIQYIGNDQNPFMGIPFLANHRKLRMLDLRGIPLKSYLNHICIPTKHRGFLNTAQVVLSSCGFQTLFLAAAVRKRAAGC